MNDQCKSAFEKWYGFEVCEDMDISTEIAWDDWQAAWNASSAANAEAK